MAGYSAYAVSNSTQNLTLVDGHVHIYNCFSIPRLFDAAYQNFTDAARVINPDANYTCVLLLTEACDDHWFRKLKSCSGKSTGELCQQIRPWSIRSLGEDCALMAECDSGEQLLIVAGRQIRTSEGLELLALAVDELFEDGRPLHECVDLARSRDAIPVIPWAVGKWLGDRGKVLTKMLAEASIGDFYLGDNSGRPVFWRNPSHFAMARRRGIRILPGSDPLPIAAEMRRVGRFGFIFNGGLSAERPVNDLRKLMRDDSNELVTYGSLEGAMRFISNQLRLRAGCLNPG